MDKKPTEKEMEYLDKWTRRSAITHGISGVSDKTCGFEWEEANHDD